MKRSLTRETKTLLDDVVKRLVGNIDVIKIVLFGSYSTGTFTKDSDLDLFVVAKTKEKGVKRYAYVSALLEPRKLPMDIIVKTPEEIKKREKYFDPFINNIQKNGMVLYEKKA
ncbi:MAG: nucleotidyltransferase domain-containing protein [Nitrospirae bacterium]|nr:nucleotidyltransferase domain-containing protein [Nitrospirota bacterium]